MHVPVVIDRSAAPINGFMILNRLGMNDQIEPINKNLEFQLQDPFLLYRNAQGVCVYVYVSPDFSETTDLHVSSHLLHVSSINWFRVQWCYDWLSCTTIGHPKVTCYIVGESVQSACCLYWVKQGRRKLVVRLV